ncbi:MAG: hypothetical protein LBI42_10135 [Chitinispirillales bacterium]|jgi:hypothetical protein|nr:hypothetical protein [Chitinispirillales bacterium]
MMNNDHKTNEAMREVYQRTNILRKPICGIVSGYHDLPYIMVAPSRTNPHHSEEVSGKISVSPKFVISASKLAETFGDVFDPETFDSDIEGRIFSFACVNNRNVKVESKNFSVQRFEEPPRERLDRVSDMLMSQEDTRTGLIGCPDFRYYPVSIDKFISEILDREFRA